MHVGMWSTLHSDALTAADYSSVPTGKEAVSAPQGVRTQRRREQSVATDESRISGTKASVYVTPICI
jgi:hypothetical protein